MHLGGEGVDPLDHLTWITPSSQDPRDHSANTNIMAEGGWVPAPHLEKTTLGKMGEMPKVS